MSETELTEELIAAAVAKAEPRVCASADRCYTFPHPPEDARQSCTPQGQCKVGWIVRRNGRESWDVWLEVSTGLVTLIGQVNT
jgi:hypothetical protein